MDLFSELITRFAVDSSEMILTADIVSILWKINLQKKIVPYERFYSSSISSNLNIEKEIQNYFRGPNYFCFVRQTPFLLTIQIRLDFLRRFIQCLRMEDGDNVPLDHVVDRTFEVLSKSCQILYSLDNPNLLQSDFNFGFTGLQNEYLQLIVVQLFSESDSHFIKRGNFYWFNSKAKDKLALQSCFIFGVICGLSISNHHSIGIQFAIALFKRLRADPISLSDLKEIDPDLGRKIENYQKENLTFEIDGYLLAEKGGQIKVTSDNFALYLTLVTDYEFFLVTEQFLSFKMGFFKTIGEISLDLFIPEELSFLIFGENCYFNE